MPFNRTAFQEARAALGLSQTDVSRRTARKMPDGQLDLIPAERVSKYETGRLSPNSESLILLAAAVERDPRELWIIEGEKVGE